MHARWPSFKCISPSPGLELGLSDSTPRSFQESGLVEGPEVNFCSFESAIILGGAGQSPRGELQRRTWWSCECHFCQVISCSQYLNSRKMQPLHFVIWPGHLFINHPNDVFVCRCLAHQNTKIRWDTLWSHSLQSSFVCCGVLCAILIYKLQNHFKVWFRLKLGNFVPQS